jgi:hypothetical protein
VDAQVLRTVVEPPGPVATVYLDASHDTEDAANAVALRWAELRAALEAEGADQATVEALESAITAGHPPVGRAGRVLVARAGEVVLDRYLPNPPARQSATWRLLPDLVPLLAEDTEPMPVVVVRVDKHGGEILVSQTGYGTAEAERAERVSGADHPLHKTRGGGASHLRMQHRVEDTWRHNVSELAGRVDALVAQTAARRLLIAGEQQSRALLVKELGDRAAGIAQELEHTGGAAGPGLDELAEAVSDAVRDLTLADRQAALDRYQQAKGRPDGLAAEGLEPVLAAFRAEAVATLLLDAGVARDGEVWITEVPTQLGTDADQLHATGIEPIGQAPVDSALVRAASGCGARVVLVGGGRTGLVGVPLTGGVGALLRYPPGEQG